MRGRGNPASPVLMEKLCTIDGCAQKIKARDMCPQHYRRWLYDGNPKAAKFTDRPRKLCSFIGCTEPVRARDLCPKHYKRLWKHGNANTVLVAKGELTFDYGDMPAICIKEDCDKRAERKGLCSAHYSRQYRWGKQEFSARNLYELCPVCKKRNYIVALMRGMCSYCWQCSRREREGTQQRLYRFWNESTLIAAGIEWHKRTGRLPHGYDWKPAPEIIFPSRTTVARHFGSWPNYVDALDRHIKRSTLRERAIAYHNR